MSQMVQFGAATVLADVIDTNRAVLDISYSTGLSASQETANFKGYPLTLYAVSPNVYSLGVVVQATVDDVDDNGLSLAWRGQWFALSTDGGNQYLVVKPNASPDHTLASTAMFRGMPLAKNAAGELIITDSGLDPADADATERLFWGTNTVTAYRFGTRWYLGVSEY